MKGRPLNTDLLKIGRAKQPIAITIPVAALIVALVISITGSSIFYIESQKQFNQNEASELELLSTLLDSNFQDFFSSMAKDALFLSQMPPIQAIINTVDKPDDHFKQRNLSSFNVWSDRLKIIFTSFMKVNNQLISIRYIDLREPSQVLVQVPPSIHKPSIFKPSKPKSNIKPAIKKHLDKVYFSPIILKKKDGKIVMPLQHIITVSSPVYNSQNGKIFGEISIIFRVEPFFQKLLTYGQKMFIANQQGDYIYHPSNEKIFDHDLVHSGNIFNDFPQLKRVFEQHNPQASFPELQDIYGNSFNAYYKNINISQFGNAAPIHLVTVYNNNEMKHELTELRNNSLALGVALSLIALVLAIFASKRITKPLTTLSEAINAYENTGTLGRLPIEAKDEVGIFARSFHNLMLNMNSALKDLEEQHFALNQHSVVGITDIKGNITYVNDKFCEISGYSQEELIGQNHRIVNSGVHDKAFFTKMYQTISQGGVWHNEICNKAKDGRLYWVESTIVAFKDLAGKPQSYVSIRNNITQRKLFEAELVKAKEIAEKADVAKSEFLASMSHEIRTPMNGVLGMLGLLLNTKLTEEQHHRVKIAESSAQSLLTLVNDILDFSKIEAGKLDLEMLDFDIHKMLDQFVESMTQMAQVKGLELILDTDGIKESNIIGDPGRIRQILTNLVSNAIKFTKEGEIIIRAALLPFDDKHWTFEFSVSDTGIGISQNQQDKLFDAFTQVDTSTTREFGGTGLGLTIVKQLCRLMHGKVELFSQSQGGSTFTCSIIVEKTEQNPVITHGIDISQSHPQSLLEMPHTWPENTRILLVEDNQINQLVATTMLNDKGLRADIAGNGLEALQSIANAPPDMPYNLILMDCQMPEMDGYEATRCIREGKTGKQNINIPIIAMTANAMRGDKEKCLASGMSDYLSKPINPQSLVKKLHHWLFNQTKPDTNAELINTTKFEQRINVAKVNTSKPPQTKSLINETVWNKPEVLNRIGGKENFLNLLITSFLDDKDHQQAQLQQALLQKDFLKIREISHTIKGIAGQLAGKQLQHISAELELLAKASNENKIRYLMPQVYKEFQELSKVFKQHLEESAIHSPQNGHHVILTKDELTEQLLTIYSKLQKSDYIDPETLSPLDHGHKDARIKILLKKLKQQTSQFDNVSALATLIVITKHLQINLDSPNDRA